MVYFIKWAFGGIGAAIVATFLGYLLAQIIWQSEDSPQLRKAGNSNISIGNYNDIGGDDKITVN